MKKLLLLFLTLTLVLTIVGCAPTAQANGGIEGTQSVVETQAPTEAPTDAPTVAPTDAPTEAPKAENESDKISEAKAKEIALDHAKLKESEVSALFVELDYDDGVLRYEVDFRQGRYEYDYDIDAKTGKILSYDKDYDD